MRVLVTGGAGFIGSHIAEALVASGATVRVFDNLSTGKRENLAHLRGRLQLLVGDLRDTKDVRRAVRGMEVVVHQGALPSVVRSIEDPESSHAVNATGTLHVLLAAKAGRVKRVVYASSSSVYGDTPKLPKREDMPSRPKSPYALSKLIGEEYCRLFASLYGLSTVSLRYFNVLGPRQDPDSPYAAVIPRFAAAYQDGGRPVIYGDGGQTRDFTYVANVVRANLLACRARGLRGEAVNIANGRRVSVRTLCRLVAERMGVADRPKFERPRAGDVRHSLADISAARKLIGYRPGVALGDGLAATVGWFLNKTQAPASE